MVGKAAPSVKPEGRTPAAVLAWTACAAARRGGRASMGRCRRRGFPAWPIAARRELARAGVRTLVQPGGSRMDPEVIKACDELGVAMVFTGMRCFRH